MLAGHPVVQIACSGNRWQKVVLGDVWRHRHAILRGATFSMPVAGVNIGTVQKTDFLKENPAPVVQSSA